MLLSQSNSHRVVNLFIWILETQRLVFFHISLAHQTQSEIFFALLGSIKNFFFPFEEAHQYSEDFFGLWQSIKKNSFLYNPTNQQS
jgi:hypothetical protein